MTSGVKESFKDLLEDKPTEYNRLDNIGKSLEKTGKKLGASETYVSDLSDKFRDVGLKVRELGDDLSPKTREKYKKLEETGESLISRSFESAAEFIEATTDLIEKLANLDVDGKPLKEVTLHAAWYEFGIAMGKGAVDFIKESAKGLMDLGEMVMNSELGQLLTKLFDLAKSNIKKFILEIIPQVAIELGKDVYNKIASVFRTTDGTKKAVMLTEIGTKEFLPMVFGGVITKPVKVVESIKKVLGTAGDIVITAGKRADTVTDAARVGRQSNVIDFPDKKSTKIDTTPSLEESRIKVLGIMKQDHGFLNSHFNETNQNNISTFSNLLSGNKDFAASMLGHPELARQIMNNVDGISEFIKKYANEIISNPKNGNKILDNMNEIGESLIHAVKSNAIKDPVILGKIDKILIDLKGKHAQLKNKINPPKKPVKQNLGPDSGKVSLAEMNFTSDFIHLNPTKAIQKFSEITSTIGGKHFSDKNILSTIEDAIAYFKDPKKLDLILGSSDPKLSGGLKTAMSKIILQAEWAIEKGKLDKDTLNKVVAIKNQAVSLVDSTKYARTA